MIIKILGCICVILTCFCMGEFFIEREKERIYLLKESITTKTTKVMAEIIK